MLLFGLHSIIQPMLINHLFQLQCKSDLMLSSKLTNLTQG